MHQEAFFFSQLTVYETLEIAIQLRLGLNPSEETLRRNMLENLVSVMDLQKVKHSIVGDAKARGISGGEKKRLAIACELIGWPSIIFVDEPTTGLDAYQALQVMRTLRRLANKGCTVIVTLHQPRHAIYEEIDRLLLLSSDGRLA